MVAVEGAFHGRTAGAAALTANSSRWYAFPRKPFEVTYVPRGDFAALRRELREDVAAMILEPVQGQAGAFALGKDYLEAAREATSACGALLIFDEVQCGMGRMGAPLAATFYGVTPGHRHPRQRHRRRLSGGRPAGQARGGAGHRHRRPRHHLRRRPLACALIATVVDALRIETSCANVAEVSAYIRRDLPRSGRCKSIQGEGLLLGLRSEMPAKELQNALLARGILTGSAADPHIVRLLPPLTLQKEHVDQLVAALAGSSGWPCPTATSTSPTSSATRCSTCWRWPAGSRTHPEPHGAGRQDPGAAFLQPVAAHPGLVPERHGAARRRTAS